MTLDVYLRRVQEETLAGRWSLPAPGDVVRAFSIPFEVVRFTPTHVVGRKENGQETYLQLNVNRVVSVDIELP